MADTTASPIAAAAATRGVFTGDNNPSSAQKPNQGGGSAKTNDPNQPPQNPLSQGLTPLKLIQTKVLYNPAELNVDHLLRFVSDLTQALTSPSSESTREVNIWTPLRYKGLNDTSYVHAYWEKRDSLEIETNSERLYPTDIAFLLDQVVAWLLVRSASRPKILELIEEYQRQPLLDLGKTDQEGFYSEEKFITTYSTHLTEAGTKILAALGRFKEELAGKAPEAKVTLDDVVTYINSQDPTQLWELDLRVKDIAKTINTTTDGNTTIHFIDAHFKPYGPAGQDFETPEVRKVLNAYYTRFREVFKELKPELREKLTQSDRLLLNDPKPSILWFQGEIDELQKNSSDTFHSHNFIEFFDRVIKALTVTSEARAAVADASADTGGELVEEVRPSLMSPEEISNRLKYEAVSLIMRELFTDSVVHENLRGSGLAFAEVEAEVRRVLTTRTELVAAVDQVLTPHLNEVVRLTQEYQKIVADDPHTSSVLGAEMLGYDTESRLFRVTAVNIHDVLDLAPKVVSAFWELLDVSKVDLATEVLAQAKLTELELSEAKTDSGVKDRSLESLSASVIPDDQLLGKLVEEYLASLEDSDPRKAQGPDQWWLSMSLAERREFLRQRAFSDQQLLLALSDRLAREVIDEYLAAHGIDITSDALGPEVAAFREQVFVYLLSQPLSEFIKLEKGEYRLVIWSQLKNQLKLEVLPSNLLSIETGVRRAINSRHTNFNNRLKTLGLEGNQRLALEQSLDALLIYSRNPEQFVNQLTIEKTTSLLGVEITEEQLPEFKKVVLYFLELRRTQLAVEGLVVLDEFSESEWRQVVAGVKTHGTKKFIAIVFGEDVDSDTLEDLKTSDPEAYQQQLYRQKYLAALWLLLEEEQRQAIVGEGGDTSHYPPNFNMSMVFVPDWVDPVAEKKPPGRVGRLLGRKTQSPARDTVANSMSQSPEDVSQSALKTAGKLAVKSAVNYLTGGTLSTIANLTGISEEKLLQIFTYLGIAIAGLTAAIVLGSWSGLLGLLIGGPLAALGAYGLVQSAPSAFGKLLRTTDKAFGGPANFVNKVSGAYQDVRHALFGSGKSTASSVVVTEKTFFASATGQIVTAATAGTAVVVLTTQTALNSALLQPLSTINKSGQVSPYVNLVKQVSPGTNFERLKDQDTFSQTVLYSLSIEPKDSYGLVVALGDNANPELVDTINVTVNEELRPGAPEPSMQGKQRTFIDLVTSNCPPTQYNGPSGQAFVDQLQSQGIFTGQADVAAGTFSGSLVITKDQKVIFPPYCETFTEEVQHSNVVNTFSINFSAVNADNILDVAADSFAQTSEVLCFGECPQFKNGCWPTDGAVTTEPYDPRLYTHKTTDAVDIANSNSNIPVFSPFAGTATFFTDGTGIFASSGGPYGNHVWLVASDGSFALIFAHLKTLAANGTKPVVPGEFLGYMGSTGNSTGQHLHYELRVPTSSLPSLLSSNDFYHKYQGYTTRQIGPDGVTPQPYSDSYFSFSTQGERKRPTILDTIVPDGIINYGHPTRTCWQLSPNGSSQPRNPISL